jgi:MFS family permease
VLVARGQRQQVDTWFAARISVFGLALSGLWTALNTVILPERVEELAPTALRGSALGLLTFIGIGLAVVVQPFAGQVSDHARLPDRRRPFIVIPALGAIAWILGIWWAPAFLWLFAAYVLLQLFMNVAQAAFQGLIPDLIPEDRRGVASGFKEGMSVGGTALGLIVTAGASTLGFGTGGALIGLALIVASGALLTWKWVPRVPPLEGTPDGGARMISPMGLIGAIQRSPHPFRTGVLARFLFLLGLYPLQRFLLYFLEDRFGIEEPGLVVGGMVLVGFLAGAAAAGIGGFLADRVGPTTVERASIIVALIGLAGLAFAMSLVLVGVFGVAVIAGAGAFQAANWAVLSDSIPEGEGAEYFGLANIATASASALVGLLGPLVDLANAYVPVGTYPMIFTIAALCVLAAWLPVSRAKQARDGAPGHQQSRRGYRGGEPGRSGSRS